MGKAIKLILIYFAIQIGAALLSVIGVALFSGYALGSEEMMSATLIPALYMGFLAMGAYLYGAGEIPKIKATWSLVSVPYLLLSLLAGMSCIVLSDFITSGLDWLPNLMENAFDQILSSWFGILGVAVFGPILEELLFRGAITRILLQKYSPVVAIILSGIVFGVFHLNPAQIAGATLIGIFLAWIYYRTQSLIPCILIHILNNGLATGLGKAFPDSESLGDLLTPSTYYYVLIPVAIIIFALCLSGMNRMTKQGNEITHT